MSQPGLKEYHIELERRNESRLRLITFAPHDLKSPINRIIRRVDSCLEDLGKTETLDLDSQEEFLSEITDYAEKAISRINDILDVPKIEAGKFELNKEWIQPNSIVANSVLTFKPDAELKQITIVMQLDENIQRLEADQEGIERVVENLLSNAINFTPQGGCITISTAETDFLSV